MLRGRSAVDWYDQGCALEAADPCSEAAMVAYERALAGRPDLADAHNNLGRVLHERSDLAAAEAHYRIALCLDRNVALYWFNLGVAVEDQGRIAEAIATYEHALTLDQELADAHFNLARIFEQIGRRSNDDLGIATWRRAVRHLTRYRALANLSRPNPIWAR